MPNHSQTGGRVGGRLPLDRGRRFRSGFDLDGLLLNLGLHGRAHLAGAVVVVGRLVGAQPEEMREELDGAPEALLRALWVAVEVCILAVVAAARVVLDRLELAVCLCLDVLVQDVVVGEVPEDALLPFVLVLLAANLAQQHAAQLLAPVDVLGVVLFNQAVEVALALVVGRLVELLLRGPIAQDAALLVDHVLAVGFAGEDGPELRHGLLSHGWCRVQSRAEHSLEAQSGWG